MSSGWKGFIKRGGYEFNLPSASISRPIIANPNGYFVKDGIRCSYGGTEGSPIGGLTPDQYKQILAEEKRKKNANTYYMSAAPDRGRPAPQPFRSGNPQPPMGFYAQLGNPGIDIMLDAGARAAAESGSKVDRAFAAASRLPERIPEAAALATATGLAAPVAVKGVQKAAPKVVSAVKTTHNYLRGNVLRDLILKHTGSATLASLGKWGQLLIPPLANTAAWVLNGTVDDPGEKVGPFMKNHMTDLSLVSPSYPGLVTWYLSKYHPEWIGKGAAWLMKATKKNMENAKRGTRIEPAYWSPSKTINEDGAEKILDGFTEEAFRK